MKSIFEYVAAARDEYRTETIEVTSGYDFSQYETLRTIELYCNSRFTTGNTDELGREKPFYNITKFRVNVATRATDLDTKDVHIEAEGPGNYAQSFLLTLFNRNWIKKADFASFLNRMGHTRAKYGGVLVMKTEHGDELKLHVVPWKDAITDQVDIRSGPKVIRHAYTPAKLKEVAESTGWKNVDDAISTAKRSREANASQDGKENRTLGENIEVWEVHAVLPTAYLKDEADCTAEDYATYSRQLHIVVLDESQKPETGDQAAITGVTLFAGTESEDPFKYLPWEEVDGRGLGVGPAEDTTEAQVWTNYSVKQKKDALDLAGKIIFQTADSSIAAKNILTDLENGSILTHAVNGPITQVNNVPASIPAFESVLKEWDLQAERVTSTSPSLTGETLPSGTPFRLAALLNQESASMFVYRRQEAGLFVQEIYRDWILPYLVKQIKKQTVLTAELSDEERDMLADLLSSNAAETAAKDSILSGAMFTQIDKDAVRASAKERELSAGKRRSFTLPKDFFTDDFNVEVVTTGEQKNKAVVLETLYNVFSVVAQNPQVLADETMRRLFNQLVETAGVSPALFKAGGTGTLSTPSPLPAQISPAEAVV
jgi:hypothetical protein